jgi:hypothetical protein
MWCTWRRDRPLPLSSPVKPREDALDRRWRLGLKADVYVTDSAPGMKAKRSGSDYELPNARAYTETCAAIRAVMRLAVLLAAGRHADRSSTDQRGPAWPVTRWSGVLLTR